MNRSRPLSLCTFLLLSIGIALPSAKPVDSVVQLPVADLASPVVAGLKTDSTRSLLAVLIRSEKQDQILLFDKHLQPLRRLNVQRGIQTFAISTQAVFYPRTSIESVCRILLSGEALKCLSVPGIVHHLLPIGNSVYAVSGGSIFELDFDTSSSRLLSYHHLLEDTIGPADADASRLVIANPLSGAAVLCEKQNWRCLALELLSPDQVASRLSKDPNEGFLSNLFIGANDIGVLAGNYHPRDGFLIRRFSFTGAYSGELRLTVPTLTDLEPGPKHSQLKPIMLPISATHWAVLGSRLIVNDSRSLSLVTYDLK